MLKKSPWLFSKPLELLFFQLCGPLLLLLIFPYFWYGEKSLPLMMSIQTAFFSYPHIALMWFYVSPQSKDPALSYSPVIYMSFIALFLALAFGFSDQPKIKQVVCTFYYALGSWHIMRQSQGICRAYDSVQSKRWGDTDLRRDGTHTVLLIACCYIFPTILFSSKSNLVGGRPAYMLGLYELSPSFYYVSIFVFCVIICLFWKNVIWKRLITQRSVPWPQASIAFSSILMSIIFIFCLPPNAYVLRYVIVTTTHNVQYFGFVWLFERYRSQEMQKEHISLSLMQRFALHKRWTWFSLFTLGSGVLIVVFMQLTQSSFGNALYAISPVSLFFSLSHYLTDGFIWQTKYNRRMPGFAHHAAEALG